MEEFASKIRTEVSMVTQAFRDVLLSYLKNVNIWSPGLLEFDRILTEDIDFNISWTPEIYYSNGYLNYDFWMYENSNKSTSTIDFRLILDQLQSEFNLTVQEMTGAEYPNFCIRVKLW